MINKINKDKCHINLEKFESISRIEEEAIYFEIINQDFTLENNHENIINVGKIFNIINFNFGINFNPNFYENESYYSIVWGCPLFNNKQNLSYLIDLIINDDIKEIQNIDGQFLILIILKKINKILIISDRFNGINLFYAKIENKLICSSSYFLLAKSLKLEGNFEWSKKVIYDVIRMNRIFGNHTYDKISRFLIPASILKLQNDDLIIESYWRPDFSKRNYFSKKNLVNNYLTLLKKSIDSLISNVKNKEIILFLSGGHDSRSVLSLIKKKITCFTISYSNNSEVQIAKKCADLQKQKFIFCQLSNDHLIYHFDEAVKICGGFHSFLDAFFVGINNNLINKNQIAIHGHGLDYFFQGSYLPTEWVKLFGKPTFFKKYRKIEGTFAYDFISNVPYRVKGIEVDQYIKSDYKDFILNELQLRIEDIVSKYSNKFSTIPDIWDMLLVDTLGRHYSRPNIDSKTLLCNVRTPSFNNDLFDFFLALPHSIRVNAFLPRSLLSKSKIGKIATANWLLPASDSPFLKTFKIILRMIRRRLFRNPNIRGPIAEDRTWPDLNNYLRQSLILQNKLNNCFHDSNVRKQLNAIDWEKVDQLLCETIEGEKEGAQFLFALVSVSRFIQLIEEIN